MKNIILIRGVCGAGKSTFSDLLNVQLKIAADDYFMVDDEYKWNPENIGLAHYWCRNEVKIAMESGYINSIAVHNTFTTETEMQPYFDLAKQFDFRITTVILENRHNSQSIHNVPIKTIEKMRARFDVKL